MGNLGFHSCLGRCWDRYSFCKGYALDLPLVNTERQRNRVSQKYFFLTEKRGNLALYTPICPFTVTIPFCQPSQPKRTTGSWKTSLAFVFWYRMPPTVLTEGRDTYGPDVK
jgi:hypothetical protein